ncbi:MAG: hypothetical protein ACOC8B_05860 [Gemmatimonadota bacterium]
MSTRRLSAAAAAAAAAAVPPLLALAILSLLACRGEPGGVTAAEHDAAALDLSPNRVAGLRTVEFPDEDPGPPFYARVTTIMNQIFQDGEYVAIPFYRRPDCVPAGFDLLQAFDPPGPDGPGAFGCPLTVEGRFLIEFDAPPGTFPVRVVTSGPTPIWFVPWSDFQAATADGDLTMAELLAMEPLRGRADEFHEMLAPRLEEHHVVIASRGGLEDGRGFRFAVNHRGDSTASITIRID